MDPNTGKLYNSLEEALADGVKHPVSISGDQKRIQQVSRALQSHHAAEKKAKYLKKKAKKKAASKSRKQNRN